MPYICPCENTDGESLDNETSVYKYNGYKVSSYEAPQWHEYVNNIITNLNQDIYDNHVKYNSKALATDDKYYGYDEDGYDLYDIRHTYIDEAVCVLTFKECDKLICDVGLRNAIELFEDCGYDEISMSELKELNGIRRFIYCIIDSCIEMHDDIECVDEERYKTIFNIDSDSDEEEAESVKEEPTFIRCRCGRNYPAGDCKCGASAEEGKCYCGRPSEDEGLTGCRHFPACCDRDLYDSD